MKVEELQKLIKDKDLKDATVQQELVDAINSDINSVVKRKKESVAEELEGYKAKIAESNLNYKKAESTIKELNDKISEQEAYSGKLKTKLYITGKAKTTLDDQAMEDVITLASKRVSKDKTNEQAIDEVLGLYFNKVNVSETPKKEEKVKSQPIPKNAYPNQQPNNLTVDSLESLRSMIGVGQFAKKKK